MPWVRALLRGQRVYARADEAGRLRVERGRVEVRYQPHDGRRYSARADNLAVTEPTPLPDQTCSEARAPDALARPNGSSKSRSASSRRDLYSAEEPARPADAVVVYADGACSGNPGPAGLGVVVVDGARRIELSEYLGDDRTNNIAELTAILRALEVVEDASRPLWVHTDSQYSIGVLSKGWKAKANVELVARVRDELHRRRGVRLHYVPGHAGVALNERADALARKAVQERRSSRAEWISSRLPAHPPTGAGGGEGDNRDP